MYEYIRNIRNQVIRKVPLLCYLNGVFHLKKVMRIYKIIRENRGNPIEDLNVPNIQDYIKTVKKLSWAEPDCRIIVEEFFSAKIIIERERFEVKYIPNDEIILICVIKDDIEKINSFLTHYRNLGIKYFAFLDNKSCDGTKEYLESQPDVNLYEIEDQYTTERREAWINRLYAYFGYNHWFLCVDSDELLSYCGCEKHQLHEIIGGATVKRFHAVMIDMYPKFNILKDDILVNDPFGEYKFFDKNSYMKESSYRYEAIYGGPRKRILSRINSNFNCRLTKYPLIYYEKGDFQVCSHYMFPYIKNYTEKVTFFLLHYKFFKSDINKYRERAMKENYSSGSIEYKTYIRKIDSNEALSFYYDGSCEMSSSESLKAIEIEGEEYEQVF